MTIPNHTIREYDELAAALGTTPKYNSAGQIIPIGRPEGKSAGTYAVYVGRAIGFYNNWYVWVSPHIVNWSHYVLLKGLV